MRLPTAPPSTSPSVTAHHIEPRRLDTRTTIAVTTMATMEKIHV